MPVCIFGHVVLVWVSIIPCESLGLLLGKDFCEAIGGVIDFRRKQMMFSVLSRKWYSMQELRAGHFRVDLLPHDNIWPANITTRWHKLGRSCH